MSNFSIALLAWYDKNKRALPWRTTADPYKILVSEYMLQQTQVSTVIDYYHRFIDRFPDIAALAATNIDEVLNQWQGLGYYRRAKLLKAACEHVVEYHQGQFPQQAHLLQQLPGIGPYTSAAVASIAFQEPVACVDGNVSRVLARVDAIDDDVRQSQTKAKIQLRASALLSQSRPGDHNQAMMELGATLCTSRNPGCGECPVNQFCKTFEAGDDPHLRPKKSKAVKVTQRSIEVALVRRGESLLIAQRPPGLLGRLWELPEISKFKGMAKEKLIGRVKHRFSHIDAEYLLFEAKLADEGENEDVCFYLQTKWIDPCQVHDLAFTKTFHKLMAIANIDAIYA